MRRLRGHDEEEPALAVDKKPVILILQDELLTRIQLASLVRSANCELYEVYPNAPLGSVIGEAQIRPSLILVSLRNSDALAQIHALRSNAILHDVPILGIAPSSSAPMARGELTALGVVGLVDAGAAKDHIVFRINQLVRNQQERRRYERVHVFEPVEVEAEGTLGVEYVVSLSVAGLGLVSDRKLVPNTMVKLRFLGEQLAPLGAVEGRVSRLSEEAGYVPRYLAGVVFYPLADPARTLIEAVIDEHLETAAK